MGLTKELKKDKLNVKIYDTRDEMGKAASADVAEAIKELLREKDEINMIFAAAPSQNDMLYHLCERDDICWERINAFHIPDLIYEMDPMYHFADARDEYLLEVPYAAIESMLLLYTNKSASRLLQLGRIHIMKERTTVCRT